MSAFGVTRRASCLSVALVAVLAAGGRAQQDGANTDPPPVEKEVLYLVAEEDEASKNAAEGEYWLGVQLTALAEVAKQQLGVEYGLTVEEVAPDSPAAKAELNRFDILVKADDTPLKEPTDLIKAVDASQGKEITLKIVRAGKDRTVNVQATKRPEAAKVAVRVARPELGEEIRRLEEALQHLKSKAGDGGLNLWLARPAIVGPKVELNRAFSFKRDEKGKPEFPSDLIVQVSKKANEPAQIHVKRGKKEWNINETEVNELPEDIRPHVLHYLGKLPPAGVRPGWGLEEKMIRVNPEGKVDGEVRIPPLPPRPPKAPVPARPVGPASRPRVAQPAVSGGAASRNLDYRITTDDRHSEKLDAILKKLTQMETGVIERLDNEVKQLRKDLDDVRGKPDSEKR